MMCAWDLVCKCAHVCVWVCSCPCSCLCIRAVVEISTHILYLSKSINIIKIKITLCVNWAVPAVFILSKWCHAMSCFAPLKNLVLTDDLSSCPLSFNGALHRSKITCWQTSCPHVHLMERCFAPLKNFDSVRMYCCWKQYKLVPYCWILLSCWAQHGRAHQSSIKHTRTH